ncbi:conserved exported protein of unknown function [Nitrospira sp. KM1]|uniref:hypothetical protein n=1 Tax=Nitrospira sp. KM1 TaxID=1936990 RepID=UPI0013A7908E|nr:hypothetical protein [Nitrospira sp. KM1]BCA57049.1 conserved exported protein of unknown function [Nitrospira sp. KM1]
MQVLSILTIAICAGFLTGPAQGQMPGRTPSTAVGASMALLATLQDADVLPPEGTPEANRVIQVVIQFQSVFMKSSDRAVSEFLDHALTKEGIDQQQIDDLRRYGWSSQTLEAMSSYYGTLPGNERFRLDEAFSSFNMHIRDFEYLLKLFDSAQASFHQRGQDIHRVFTQRRREMPGSGGPHRKERPHGDQGLYSDQGQGGTDKRRLAISSEAHGS